MIYLALLSGPLAWSSFSPAMHGAALKTAGLTGTYQAFEVPPDELGAAVSGLGALGFRGANLSAPFKQSVIPFLKGLSREAKEIKAVNTLVKADDGFWGYNTDAEGFLAALGPKPTGPVLVLGTGGAARAVLYALSGSPQIYLAGRSPDKTRKLSAEFGARPLVIGHDTFDAPYALIINATTASTTAEMGPTFNWIWDVPLRPDAYVFDLNYNRQSFALKDLAAKHAAGFSDGRLMLAHQGRLSFRLWTGIDLPPGVFIEPLNIEEA